MEHDPRPVQTRAQKGCGIRPGPPSRQAEVRRPESLLPAQPLPPTQVPPKGCFLTDVSKLFFLRKLNKHFFALRMRCGLCLHTADPAALGPRPPPSGHAHTVLVLAGPEGVCTGTRWRVEPRTPGQPGHPGARPKARMAWPVFLAPPEPRPWLPAGGDPPPRRSGDGAQWVRLRLFPGRVASLQSPAGHPEVAQGCVFTPTLTTGKRDLRAGLSVAAAKVNGKTTWEEGRDVGCLSCSRGIPWTHAGATAGRKQVYRPSQGGAEPRGRWVPQAARSSSK